jgi:hypothetical protein
MNYKSEFVRLRGIELRAISVGVLALVLSGCDIVGVFAKEAAVAATSHRGWSTFTFKGQLPANFGIDATAWYGPDDPDKASCQSPTIEPGKTVTRRYGKQYSAAIRAQPQDFNFEIPLNYYKGLCGMSLRRVKLEINIRYGEEKWQTTYANGNLFVSEVPTEDTVTLSRSGIYDVIAACSFMFQESKLNFGIDKFMNCRSARIEFLKTELADKTINLKIEVNSEEKPTHGDTWIKFPNGWKPCLPKPGGWIRCQSPPVFKTFEMNGKTCTIYPHCKEQ